MIYLLRWISNMLLDRKYQLALGQARQASTQEAPFAWEEVEELGKAIDNSRKKHYDNYCSKNPSAIECLIYDP